VATYLLKLSQAPLSASFVWCYGSQPNIAPTLVARTAHPPFFLLPIVVTIIITITLVRTYILSMLALEALTGVYIQHCSVPTVCSAYNHHQ
jgi:hypothetical protein